MKEEQKVAALVHRFQDRRQASEAIMKACVNCSADNDACFDPTQNPALKREIRAAKKDQFRKTTSSASSVRQAGLQGPRVQDLRHRLGFGSLSDRFRQNSNNSVSLKTTSCALLKMTATGT